MKFFALSSLSLIILGNTFGFVPSKFSLEMEQVYKSVISGKIKKIPAMLDYSKPGKFRFKDFKNNLEVVSNGEQSWEYLPARVKSEKDQVRITESSSNAVVKLFKTIDKGLQSNKSYKVNRLNPNLYKLDFAPLTKDKSWRVSRALIEFRGSKKDKQSKSLEHVRKLVIFYTDGKKIDLNFKKFDLVQKFPKSHFVFETEGKNLKIIRN